METENLPDWQRVLRAGIWPQLTDEMLSVLRTALETDDERLIQGATVTPLVPTSPIVSKPCTGACLMAYPLWLTAGVLEETFYVECAHGEMVMACDRLTGHHADARHVMNHWDNLPRVQARAEFLAELLLEQERRVTA